MNEPSDLQGGCHTQQPATTYPPTQAEVEQLVVMERHHLYNAGRPCGAVALRRHLCEQLGVRTSPSVRQISQVLTRYGLTHGRTGWYEGDAPEWLPPLARKSKLAHQIRKT